MFDLFMLISLGELTPFIDIHCRRLHSSRDDITLRYRPTPGHSLQRIFIREMNKNWGVNDQTFIAIVYK